MEERIARVLYVQGTTRVYEMSDGTVIERVGGSASWRNNNPGNLKFEFAGSADKTVHSHRSRERALQAAQRSYDGVVDLDQWGNAIFETYEAGRTAKLKLLEDRNSHKTVEQMLSGYSRADYSGSTHHRAQAEYIHREASKLGLDLHGKAIGAMTEQERNALADGIRGFEGWKVGSTRSGATDAVRLGDGLRPAELRRGSVYKSDMLTQGDHGTRVTALQQTLAHLGYRSLDGTPLPADGRFGPSTRAAVEAFQREHGLKVDGIVGSDTRRVLAATQANPFVDASHPQHALYAQALRGVHAEEDRRGIPHGLHSEHLAGALTAAAANAGLARIDRVELSATGTLARAVQVHPLRDEPSLNRTSAAIDTHAALTRTQHQVERTAHPSQATLVQLDMLPASPRNARTAS